MSEQALEITKLLEKISGIVPVAGTYLAALFGSVTVILEASQKQEENKEAFYRLATDAADLLFIINDITKGNIDHIDYSLRVRVDQISELLEEIVTWYQDSEKKSSKKKKSKQDSTHLKDFTSRLDKQHRGFMTTAALLNNMGNSRLQKTMDGVWDMERSNTEHVQSIENIVIKLDSDEGRRKILQWLSPPDPSTNHNAACQKCTAETGTWFMRGKEFENWKKDEKSFLWLHGIPGCGKTILCSTIVDQMIEYCRDQSFRAIAYFYFSFDDQKKQSVENLVRALIVQLISQRTTVLFPDGLKKLFTEKQSGQQQPKLEELFSVLREVVQQYQSSYIVIDALDECESRDDLLRWISEMQGWNLTHLHMLCTSRTETDIESSLSPQVSGNVSIQSGLVQEDIRRHVHNAFTKEDKFKRWPEDMRTRIEDSLSEGAQGMFQLIVYQLKDLRTCTSKKEVDSTLNNLPKDLDTTYARILSRIPESQKANALRILQWVAFSARPLTLMEMAHALAIDTDNRVFDEDALPLDPDHGVLHLCSSLINVSEATEEEESEATEKRVLTLSHYSVKEYLVSRCQNDVTSYYALNPATTEYLISYSCLIYLLQFDTLDFWKSNRIEKFALASYASEFWVDHAREAQDETVTTLKTLTMEFLSCPAFVNWVRAYNIDCPEETQLAMPETQIASPLYYMTLAQLDWAVEGLLELEALSLHGKEKTAELLIGKGVDINLQGGRFGSALGAACARGQEKTVELLISKGADINLQGGIVGSALGAASGFGHEKTVELLIANGAEINLQGGDYGSALGAASALGQEKTVELLIYKGAEINLQGGRFGSALGAASALGQEKTVELLIYKGADINLQGGDYGSALGAACAHGQEKTVELLISKGADINLQGGNAGSALGVASYFGCEKTVELLIANGADINLQAGHYGSALGAASALGQEKTVELLIYKGADINLQGGRLWFCTRSRMCSWPGEDGGAPNIQRSGHQLAGGRIWFCTWRSTCMRNDAVADILFTNGAYTPPDTEEENWETAEED